MKSMKNKQSGFVVVMVLSVIVILSLIVGSYFFITVGELASNTGSRETTSGFYAAEGGLNLRAEEIRAKFNDRGQPAGTSPTANTADDYCAAGGNQGSGDFACKDFAFSTTNVRTYVEDITKNTPISGTVPAGEEFEGLLYQGYQYDVFSTAYNKNALPAAILQMRFTSRLIPLFQFAIFYDKDLEFSNTATLTVGGRVHTNADLYFNAGSGGSTLTVDGLTTAVGQTYRGYKDQNACGGTVQVRAIGAGTPSINCSSARIILTNTLLNPWNGGIKQGVKKLNVPKPDAFTPTPGEQYWDNAELRVVYNVATNQVQVRDASNNINVPATNTLTTTCAGSATNTPNSFYDRREGPIAGGTSGKFITMLDINMGNLLSCINSNAGDLNVPDGLANTTDNGLVLYFTVIGPNSNLTPSGYGVRLRNGNNLSNTRGVTVVSDQPVYIEGDYNNFNNGAGWVPAAVMGDVINILSNNYKNAASRTGAVVVTSTSCTNGFTAKGQAPLDCRPATSTTIRAAIVGATDSTGNAEGAAGRDKGISNGGVNNMMRYHEEWGFNGGLQGGAATFTYQGSLVSLNTPLHMSGTWSLGGTNANPVGRSVYNPPIRNWTYDQRFNTAVTLPPLTPRAVSLKQERFNRSFDRTTR
jgi:Tfp pilus assembly protein PilX